MQGCALRPGLKKRLKSNSERSYNALVEFSKGSKIAAKNSRSVIVFRWFFTPEELTTVD